VHTDGENILDLVLLVGIIIATLDIFVITVVVRFLVIRMIYGKFDSLEVLKVLSFGLTAGLDCQFWFASCRCC
jgi:hypothetical protein